MSIINDVTRLGSINTSNLAKWASQWDVSFSDETTQTFFIVVIRIPGIIYGDTTQTYITNTSPVQTGIHKTIFDNAGNSICSFTDEDLVRPKFAFSFSELQTAAKADQIWDNFETLLREKLKPSRSSSSSASAAAAAAAADSAPSSSLPEGDRNDPPLFSRLRRFVAAPLSLGKRVISSFGTFRGQIAIVAIAGLYFGWTHSLKNDMIIPNLGL